MLQGYRCNMNDILELWLRFKEFLSKWYKKIIIVVIILISLQQVFSDSDSVVIHPFKMSPKLIDSGLDGESFSSILFGKINNIYKFARTQHASSVKVYEESPVELEFEGVKFSSMLRYVREFIGMDGVNVNGVLYQNDEDVVVTLLVDNVTVYEGRFKEDQMDELITEVSENVIEYTNPYVLARYLSNREYKSTKKIKTLIYKCLTNSKKEDDYWALNLLGNLYFNIESFDEASRKYHESYRLAKSMGEEFVVGLSNYGAALASMGKYDEANKLLDEAIKVDGYYYHPYFVKGINFYRTGNYKKALKNLLLAKERNIANPHIYYHLSKISWLDGFKTDDAIRFLEMAMSLYQKENNQVYYKRGSDWLEQICFETTDDVSLYDQCSE